MKKRIITTLGVTLLLIISLFLIINNQKIKNNNKNSNVANVNQNLNNTNLNNQNSNNINKNNDKTESYINLSDAVVIEEKHTQLQNENNNIDIKYPVFQGLEESYHNEINNIIYKKISHEAIYNEMVLGDEEREKDIFTYEMDYDRYNCGDFVSIVANQYIHIGNGRPRLQKKCFVVNVENNSIMKITDLFDGESDFRKDIIEEINKQAKERKVELIGGNGLDELNENQAFYIKDNKLVIYFEASEIAATAVGELEFIMPYEMINNKFVI